MLDTKLSLHHDGYDCYGPESNIYNFTVLFIKDFKIFYQIFHREYWFDGNYEEFLPQKSHICLNCKMIKKGYYSIYDIQKIKNELCKIFNDLIIAKIFEFIINTIYKPEMLTFDETYKKILDLPFNLHLKGNNNI